MSGFASLRAVLLGVAGAWLAALAADVSAELYRWRDPQSGSIKYSSYPPPWYGNEALEGRAPKVEVVGPRQASIVPKTPADQMADKVAEVIRFMEKRREQLLERMTLARASPGFSASDPKFREDLQAYRAVTRELDKFDPKGAAARRRADERVFENLGITDQDERSLPGAQARSAPVPRGDVEPVPPRDGSPPPVDRPDGTR